MNSNVPIESWLSVDAVMEIDGSMGEGGGAVLRTALALSAVSGREVLIRNIRAGRPRPGLAPQHLRGAEALAKLTDAELEGAELRSQELRFKPRTIGSGCYRVDIGTAGSTTLILQALMPTAAFADGPVDIEVTGGTDNPLAIPIDFLENVTLPTLRRMGYRGEVERIRRGHYPRGGGAIRARIQPVERLKALNLIEPGKVASIKGISHCVRLPKRIAVRQAHAAKRALLKAGYTVDIKTEFYKPGKDLHLGPGTGIVLWAETERGAVLGSSSLGRRGKPAENVGREAAQILVEQLRTGCAVDRWLMDQLVPYLALGQGKSEITCAELTSHAVTNIELVEKILGVKFEVQGGLGEPARISVEGIGFRKNSSEPRRLLSLPSPSE